MPKTFLTYIFIITAIFAKADAWDTDSLATIFKGRQLDPVEGVWQLPNQGATFLVTRASAASFDIYLLYSSRLDIPIGTKIGSILPTADGKKYDASFRQNALGDKRIKKSKAVLSVNDNGMMSIKPYSTGKKFSFRRWIPYYLRLTVREENAPDGLIGAKKIYPFDPYAYKPSL